VNGMFEIINVDPETVTIACVIGLIAVILMAIIPSPKIRQNKC